MSEYSEEQIKRYNDLIRDKTYYCRICDKAFNPTALNEDGLIVQFICDSCLAKQLLFGNKHIYNYRS